MNISFVLNLQIKTKYSFSKAAYEALLEISRKKKTL